MKRICKVCGSEFEVKFHNSLYCSDKCRKEMKRIRSNEFRKNNKQLCLDGEKTRRWKKKADKCCKKHGGIDSCPYPDCIC